MTELSDPTIEYYCMIMHDAYEQAAVEQGWETNPKSRVDWADVPEANKATMRVAVRAVFEAIRADLAGPPWSRITNVETQPTKDQPDERVA